MVNNNFTGGKPLCYWVQHILPLVYDDSLSYMELLGKVTKKLNDLIVNNNKLPDFIAELIKEYISSGAIEKVLAEVLADYMLNVKFPPAGLTPATGDGSADDTEAIQGCIDYAFNHGGMAVYFPSGKYLTQPLTLKNKATLFGQDRYSTVLVMKGGATTAMFTGEVDELTLTGLGFDGNMDIQVNNVNLFDITVGSAIITNALLTDGYTLLKAVVNKDLQLDNIIFDHAVEHGVVLSGGGFVQADNLIFNSVSALVGKDFLTISTNNSIFEKIKLVGATPTGITVNGNFNIVKFWQGESVNAYTDNGTNNNITVYTESKKEVLTGDVSLNAVNKEEVLTGNVSLNAVNKEEVLTGNVSLNAVNKEEVLTGDISLNAVNKEEVLTGDISLNAVNKEEVLTGDKTVTSENSTETISGDKTVNTDDYALTATGNYTASIGKDFTETVTGNKHLDVMGNKTENVEGNVNETTTGTKEETAETIFLNPTNPLKYGEVVTAQPFNYLAMQDKNGNAYKLLATANENFDVLPFLDVTKCGVLPNGEDMTDKLNALIVQYADSYTIYLKRGVYTFNGTINITKESTHFKCDGRISSTADIAILLTAVDCVIDIFQLYGNGSGVGFQNGTPDMTTSYGNSRLKFDFIYNFNTAIKFYANGNNGIQNNITTLDRIDVCDIGILFECGDVSTPWINQNTFHGGWIAAGSTKPNGVGIKFINGANMVDRFNGNVFNDFSCENTRYPIDIVYAWHNVFNNFRMLENVGTDLIKCGSDTEDNKFIGASNYVNYKNITDNGIYNHYWLTFHDDSSINICNEAVFRSGCFIPVGEYFKTKLFALDRGTAIALDGWVDYMIFDGTNYNVEAILPIKYSYGATANSFILEIGTLAGTANIVLWGGQTIATSKNTNGISGVQLKANMKYLFIPVGDISWKVVPLTISAITNSATGYINDNHVDGTATVSGESATLNSDCVVRDGSVQY